MIISRYTLVNTEETTVRWRPIYCQIIIIYALTNAPYSHPHRGCAGGVIAVSAGSGHFQRARRRQISAFVKIGIQFFALHIEFQRVNNIVG